MNKIITPSRDLILPPGIIRPGRDFRLPYQRVPFARRQPLYADVVHDGTDASAVSTTNNTLVACTITAGTLTNGILVCWVGTLDASAGAATISSVASALGGALTLLTGSLVTVAAVDGADWQAAIYYLLNPGAVAHVITMTMSENTNVKYIGAAAFQDVNQTTPFGTPVTGSGTTGSPITASLTGTGASGMAVGGFLSFASSSSQDVAVSSPATQSWEQEEQVFEGSSMAAGYSAGAASIAATRESSTCYLYTAAELKAVGGAAGAIPNKLVMARQAVARGSYY